MNLQNALHPYKQKIGSRTIDTQVSTRSGNTLKIEQWSCRRDETGVEAGDGYTRVEARRVIRDGVEEVQIELEVGKFDKNTNLRSQFSSLILHPDVAAQLVKALTEVQS